MVCIIEHILAQVHYLDGHTDGLTLTMTIFHPNGINTILKSELTNI